MSTVKEFAQSKGQFVASVPPSTSTAHGRHRRHLRLEVSSGNGCEADVETAPTVIAFTRTAEANSGP